MLTFGIISKIQTMIISFVINILLKMEYLTKCFYVKSLL